MYVSIICHSPLASNFPKCSSAAASGVVPPLNTKRAAPKTVLPLPLTMSSFTLPSKKGIQTFSSTCGDAVLKSLLGFQIGELRLQHACQITVSSVGWNMTKTKLTCPKLGTMLSNPVLQYASTPCAWGFPIEICPSIPHQLSQSVIPVSHCWIRRCLFEQFIQPDSGWFLSFHMFKPKLLASKMILRLAPLQKKSKEE